MAAPLSWGTPKPARPESAFGAGVRIPTIRRSLLRVQPRSKAVSPRRLARHRSGCAPDGRCGDRGMAVDLVRCRYPIAITEARMAQIRRLEFVGVQGLSGRS